MTVEFGLVKRARRLLLASAALGCAFGGGTPHAQSDLCSFIPDKRNPKDQILHCGAMLTVKPASGTSYRPVQSAPGRPPEAIELDSGAILIEYHGGKGKPGLQILTPQAVAAVRGTRWAMEVSGDRTGCLVLTGAVQVSSPRSPASVTLHPGDGVDVTSAGGPLVVKRWGQERVSALLSRF